MNGQGTTYIWIALLGICFALGSCNVTLQIKDGTTAYELKKYTLAVELLKEEYDKAKDKAEKFRIAKMIGESYLAFSQPAKAEPWFKKAVDTDVDPAILFDYAMVLKQNEKYDEALTMLEAFYQYDRSQRIIVEGHVAAIKEIQAAQQEESYTRIVPLTGVNTDASEYAPMLMDDMLTYASNKNSASGTEDAWTGLGYTNIMAAMAKSVTEFLPEDEWAPGFNSEWHEAVLTYHPNGEELYFTRCGMEDDNKDVCRIYRSFKEFDIWSDAEVVPIFDDSTNVGHPFITADGKQLYFSSDATFGYGGKDLYVSNRVGNEWDAPINLGPRVNTSGDELFPVIGPAGQLIFASDGQFGYGGMDLFTAEKRGRIFTNVTSLGYPINTGADDISIWVLPSEEDSVLLTGYFASNRKGGMGGDDLYFFEKRMTPAPVLPPPVFILAGLVEEKAFEDPKNPNSLVIGKKPLAGATLEITDISDPERPYVNERLNTLADGTFRTFLDQDVDYSLQFTKNGYFSNTQELTTRNQEAEDGDTVEIYVSVVLDKIYKEVEFVIDNIYYDLDSANIRPDAALVLDSLAGVLQNNPGLRVELGSHTDSRGSDDYNLQLSQRRAESAVRYLVKSGISADRMIARGYGETRLVNSCTNGVQCTEEQHQENRRTTFKILGFDFQSKPQE